MGEGVDAAAIHAALDQERNARGLSWRQVAQQADVSPSSLSRMAQGAAAPSLDGLVKLADWANVSLDELVGRGNRRIAAADSAPTTAISTYLRGRKDLTSANTKVLEAIITAAYDQLRKQQVEDG